MAADSGPTFSCSGCGRQFRWKPELAGRHVKCPCGQVMTAPSEPEPGEPDFYELADAPVEKISVTRLPPPAASSVAGAVPMKTTLTYATPRDAATDGFSPEKLRDFQAPLLLLGIGLAVRLASAWIHGARSPQGMRAAMIHLGVSVGAETVLLIVALLIAARFRGIHLGNPGSAILKLAALCVVPGAAVTLLYPILMLALFFGPLIGLVIEFCLYFALLGYFFDLDQSDTWFCIAVIFVVFVAVTIIEIWLIASYWLI